MGIIFMILIGLINFLDSHSFYIYIQLLVVEKFI